MRHLLDEARSRGLTIYWGLKGFAVKTRKDLHGKVVSLVYGYPPGFAYKSEAYVEVFLRPDLFTAAELAGMEAVKSVAKVEKGGQFTLRLPVRADTVDKVPDVLKPIWDVERLMAAAQAVEEPGGGDAT